MIKRAAIQSIILPILLLLPMMVTEAVRGEQSASPPPGQSSGPRTLAHFFGRLRAGRPVTVSYLRDTVESGPGRSATGTLRTEVTGWLRSRFPAVPIEEIDASVAGTGSLYATLRLRRDLLALKPDLVFVELAAGDNAERDQTVRRSVEGLLRQLLLQPQQPGIVILYPAIRQESLPIEAWESMAAYYHIPSLDLEREARNRRDQQFPLTATTVAKFEAGRIIEFLSREIDRPLTPLPRTIPPPLVSDELNYGEMRTIAELKHDEAWKVESSDDRALPNRLLVSSKPGATIETLFEGTVVGLTYLMGPDSGSIEVEIDGRPAPAPLAKIDCHDQSRRIGTTILPGGLPPGEHRLTIRLLKGKGPQSRGRRVRLGYLVTGGVRPEKL